MIPSRSAAMAATLGTAPESTAFWRTSSIEVRTCCVDIAVPPGGWVTVQPSHPAQDPAPDSDYPGIEPGAPASSTEMLTDHAITIRPADAPTLAFLAALAGEPPLALPALIGDLDGVPTAALSLADGRVAADPFRPSAGVVR